MDTTTKSAYDLPNLFYTGTGGHCKARIKSDAQDKVLIKSGTSKGFSTRIPGSRWIACCGI